MSERSERRGAGEVLISVAAVVLFAVIGSCVLKEAVDLPDRADRVGDGSDAAEAVAEENPPGGVPTVPEPTPNHTTPPVSEVECEYEGDTELDFRQKEFAAGRSRRHDEPRGAVATCEGGLGAVGNPTSLGGPLEAYEECIVLEPADWNAGVDTPTGRFIVYCFLNKTQQTSEPSPALG